ncbi:MAG: hypothetical protein IIB77_02950 [Proteobacteria bacterium]|nr:hypothetical protein [Pseudomonadota bacterium]
MIRHHRPNQFEREVIRHILKKDAPKYLSHLQYLFVDRRESTGVGIYVNFEYLERPPIFSSENITIGETVYAEIEGLEGGAAFLLYIEKGRITMLEAVAHVSDTWPADISKFEIQYI